MIEKTCTKTIHEGGSITVKVKVKGLRKKVLVQESILSIGVVIPSDANEEDRAVIIKQALTDNLPKQILERFLPECTHFEVSSHGRIVVYGAYKRKGLKEIIGVISIVRFNK